MNKTQTQNKINQTLEQVANKDLDLPSRVQLANYVIHLQDQLLKDLWIDLDFVKKRRDKLLKQAQELYQSKLEAEKELDQVRKEYDLWTK